MHGSASLQLSPVMWIFLRFLGVTHVLAVYVKEGLPFGCDLSLENSDSYLRFRLVLVHSVS